MYRIPDLVAVKSPFGELPTPRGYITKLSRATDGSVDVVGYLFLPERPLDKIQVYVDGVQLLGAPLTFSPDLANFFSWTPYSGASLFNFSVPAHAIRDSGTSFLEIVAFDGDAPAARLLHLIRGDLDRLPFPPEELAFRVTHNRDPNQFRASGLQGFGDFLRAALRHDDLSSVRRVLDWGCGCGRVSAHLMAIENGPEVFGCDIDPSAIEWDNQHLRAGGFALLATLPPTPYPDSHFDMIISYSVLTHLTSDVQDAWIREMRRILSPGGIFLATVNGKFTRSFQQQTVEPTFPSSGIDDNQGDGTLSGIAPENYYRTTYQTADYTAGEFSKYFKVLEYLERGVSNFQDLIVVRKI